VSRFHDVWDVGYKLGAGMSAFYVNKDDGIDDTIHDYESNVMAIEYFTNALKQLPTVNEEIIIVDGNNAYKNFPEWQVKPKQSSHIKIVKADTVQIAKNQTVKAMTL
jgi:hypothetical protein